MSLDVYLYGERIATLFPVGKDDYRLAYAPEQIDGFAPGAAILSNSLPASEEPYSDHATRAFVEGLLPEGLRRRRLARELGIDPGDGYAMIAALGRDCAGGVSFLPSGEAVRPVEAASAAWLTDEELEGLLAPQPDRLLDPLDERRMRFALAGTRHKLALVRERSSERWAWPEVGAPSTHVLKPESGEHPEEVPNEMFCTTVVREAGLPVAPTSIETVAGRCCIVSERFDRTGEGLEARRFHQETFCQALGFGPASGEADGPGFAESSGLLRAVGEGDDVTTLLAAAFANYILGNGDAHGRNFALILVEDGALLAPLYDISSTAVYDDPLHTGMTIAADYDETAYLLELAQICEEADIDFEHCRRVAANVSARIETALETVARRAREEGWHAPVIDSIVELAASRAVGLGYEVQY